MEQINPVGGYLLELTMEISEPGFLKLMESLGEE